MPDLLPYIRHNHESNFCAKKNSAGENAMEPGDGSCATRVLGTGGYMNIGKLHCASEGQVAAFLRQG